MYMYINCGCGFWCYHGGRVLALVLDQAGVPRKVSLPLCKSSEAVVFITQVFITHEREEFHLVGALKCALFKISPTSISHTSEFYPDHTH